MKHQRMHGLEKIQVEVAAAATLAAVYFWIAPALAASDPLAPIVFLARGDFGRLGGLVLWLCGLGALCGALTISSRKEGALLALLVGAGGASLRSPSIRPLLWGHAGAVDRLYFSLIGEVLLLWCGLVLASLVIDLVRGLLGGLCPRWAWKSPLPEITDEARARVAADGRDAADGKGEHFARPGGLLALFGYRGSSRARAAGGKGAAAEALEALSCAGMAILLSVVLLSVLLQSSDRGQILFALAGAFAVGTLVANQLFPTPYGIAAWGTPVVAAAVFYALAAFAAIRSTPTGWLALPHTASPLPMDWLSAGGGGAVLGFWISSRLHELRLLERDEKQAQASEE
jgi:hypothetical protein